MEATGAGTAIMLGVAAVLWFLYFVPTWLRRREYLATERTATRLQQTMRVLAETAEVPDAIRAEVTARDAARQERILRAERRRADAFAVRQAAEVRPETPSSSARFASFSPRGDAPSVDARRRQRMRRARALSALVIIAAAVIAIVQVALILTTGMAAGAWVVLAGAGAAGAAATAVQRRLDVLSTPHAAAPARSRTAVRVPNTAVDRAAAPVPWTPVAMPKPLYLSSPAPESTVVRTDLRQALRDAAADSERNLRAAQAEPEVVPFRTAKPSRYAGMGVLEPDAVEATDLDEILRRRRNAG